MNKPNENGHDSFSNLLLGTILAAVTAILLVTGLVLFAMDDLWALAPFTGFVVLWELGKGEESPKDRGLRAANEPLALNRRNRRVR